MPRRTPSPTADHSHGSKPPFRRTFAERYSSTHDLSPDQFADHLLQRTLHAPLRWLWPLLANACRHQLAEDRHCLRTIGTLRSKRALHAELVEFSALPCNRSFGRRFVRLRISTLLVRRVLQSLPDT